uniref:Uncharacterized protein n=1 Tax=Zea mays TaxID=4577 RepID=A0A804QSV8_MAIZE
MRHAAAGASSAGIIWTAQRWWPPRPRLRRRASARRGPRGCGGRSRPRSAPAWAIPRRRTRSSRHATVIGIPPHRPLPVVPLPSLHHLFQSFHLSRQLWLQSSASQVRIDMGF